VSVGVAPGRSRTTTGQPSDVLRAARETGEPIDTATLEATIRRFVDAFVIESRRERAYLFLTSKPKQRIDTLQKLPDWVERSLQTELRRDQIPTGLRGVLIDDDGARHTTIDAAMSSESGALFIADIGELALLVPEIGPLTLCRRA
jgi:hypothetical protein